jgi:hypothetical protein
VSFFGLYDGDIFEDRFKVYQYIREIPENKMKLLPGNGNFWSIIEAEYFGFDSFEIQ